MGYTYGTLWTEELLINRIFDVIKILKLKRMPTKSEIFSLRHNDPLHNKIVRTGGYRFWAGKLNLEIKESESKLGWNFEEIASDILKNKGFIVKGMPIKHPFDLLVNNRIKVDVKCATPYKLNGSIVHTFGINKKYQTCDLYILFALNYNREVERIFVIPSTELQLVSMCIGKESKYNKFIDRWDFLHKFDELYRLLIS